MTRKWFRFLLAAVSIILILSGCGSGSPAAPAANAPVEDSISTAGDEPSPQAALTPSPTSVVNVPQTAADESEESPEEGVAPSLQSTIAPQPLDLTSPSFGSEEAIPIRFSCDGEDISPALIWSEPPEGTMSFALIFDDPDAVEVVGYTWIHWTVFDLPAEMRSLPEAIPAGAQLPEGGSHGENSWRNLGYGGPCPPTGTHMYSFTLYALDKTLSLSAPPTAEGLLLEMEGHILEQAELKGSYTR